MFVLRALVAKLATWLGILPSTSEVSESPCNHAWGTCECPFEVRVPEPAYSDEGYQSCGVYQLGCCSGMYLFDPCGHCRKCEVAEEYDLGCDDWCTCKQCEDAWDAIPDEPAPF